MAITWDVQITNVNLAAKRADVTATRTDSADPDNPKTYRLTNTPLETTADRTLVINTIKSWVLAEEASADQVATFVSNLEQQAVTALETWETTR